MKRLSGILGRIKKAINIEQQKRKLDRPEPPPEMIALTAAMTDDELDEFQSLLNRAAESTAQRGKDAERMTLFELLATEPDEVKERLEVICNAAFARMEAAKAAEPVPVIVPADGPEKR